MSPLNFSQVDAPLYTSIDAATGAVLPKELLQLVIDYIPLTDKETTRLLLNPAQIPFIILKTFELETLCNMAANLAKQKESETIQNAINAIAGELCSRQLSLFKLKDLALMAHAFFTQKNSSNSSRIVAALDLIAKELVAHPESLLHCSLHELAMLTQGLSVRQTGLYGGTIVFGEEVENAFIAIAKDVFRRQDVSESDYTHLLVLAENFSTKQGECFQNVLNMICEKIDSYQDLSRFTMQNLTLSIKNLSKHNHSCIKNVFQKFVIEIKNRGSSSRYTREEFRKLISDLEKCPDNDNMKSIRTAIVRALQKKPANLSNLRLS